MKNIFYIRQESCINTCFKMFMYICILCADIPDLYAQHNATTGYIVTNQNDTIRGNIKYNDWFESPEKIDFKEANMAFKSYSAAAIKAFGIDFNRSIYKSKKIGVLDITLSREYRITPSLVATDSAQIFLKELVSGKSASLYLYLNTVEKSHYFLEQNGILTELYNYPYYRTVGSRTHLLSIDQYKNQLKEITAISPQFGDSLPPYQEKYLKRYVKNFNKSFLNHGEIYESKSEILIFDLDVNIGLENWNEVPVVLKRKFTYGLGARISFPGKFHNRFLKANLFITPDAWLGYDPLSRKRGTVKTYEVSVGSYIGKRRLRPYVGLHHSGVSGGHRFDFLGFQAGLSLDRRINLEIGHFANLASSFTETTFWTLPRISLHYMINLSLNHTKY